MALVRDLGIYTHFPLPTTFSTSVISSSFSNAFTFHLYHLVFFARFINIGVVEFLAFLSLCFFLALFRFGDFCMVLWDFWGASGVVSTFFPNR